MAVGPVQAEVGRIVLPDHLQKKGTEKPFAPEGLEGLPAGERDRGADKEEGKRGPDLQPDLVSISPEARALFEQELGPEEEQAVRQLQQGDREVRAHEQGHVAAAGHLATSGPNYSYQTGPDGRQYAVDGEVQISFGEGKTPQETLKNAQAAQRAALAPGDPSGQDRQVASRAAAMAGDARREMAAERRGDGEGVERAAADQGLDLMA